MTHVWCLGLIWREIVQFVGTCLYSKIIQYFFILLLQCYDSYNNYYYYHHYYYYCNYCHYYYYHYYYYSYQYDIYYHYDFIIMGNYSSNNLINLLSINHYHVQLEKLIFSSWQKLRKIIFWFFHLFCWQFDHTYLIFIIWPIFFPYINSYPSLLYIFDNHQIYFYFYFILFYYWFHF